jgi:exopolysaccharide biosynthesis polyprenyl glycosylphosphotransferase
MVGKENMASMRAKEEALKLSQFFIMNDKAPQKRLRRRFFSYKFVLFFHDILMVLFAFVLSGFIIGPPYLLGGDLIQSAIFFILSMIVLIFFPTFNLYNYHVIFLKKNHWGSLAKSFGWSLLALGAIISIYKWPHLFKNYNNILIIFLIAVGMMLVSRLFMDQLLNIVRSMGVSFLFVGLIGLIRPEENPIELVNWWVILFGFLSAAGILMASRYFVVHVILHVWKPHFRRQVAIIGSDEEAKSIINCIIDNNAPYWVSGTVGKSNIDISIPKSNLGDLKRLPLIIEKMKIDEIIVTDAKMDKQTLIALLDYCISEGLTVWFLPTLMPIIDIKLYIDNFCDLKMIRLCSQKNTWIFNKIKHGLDALISLPLFVVVSPFFLIIALAIKLNSKGPVFYRTSAVGKNGEVFKMFKFRSMRTDSDSEVHKTYVTKLIKGQISNGGKSDQPLKITDDPRVTSVGKFLRKFSLDELPQVINVLKGDMSLVGPRPCLPYEYEVYQDWHKKRASVRPGISGLWQVVGRSEVLFEDMILLDLYYIYNRNLLMDFSVLYETIFVVLGKRGAY